MEDKIDIMSLTKSELKDFFTEIGEKPFRAKQLFSWLHNKCVYDYDDMTNLSKSLRDTLKEKTYGVTVLIFHPYTFNHIAVFKLPEIFGSRI